MSRILKRPMFRKGGPAMEGVMNGIEDRTNFKNGNLVQQAEQRKELLKQLVGQPSPGSALTNFLLQFGPAIATRPATGNIFTDVLGAAQAPAANLAKQRAAEDQFQRQLGLVAAKSVIDPKTRKLFVAETEQDQINKERDAILSDKFSPRKKKLQILQLKTFSLDREIQIKHILATLILQKELMHLVMFLWVVFTMIITSVIIIKKLLS